MKKILKYYLVILIVAGWLILSLLGFINRDTIYRTYSIDIKSTPYFALVLEGIRDGVYPWSDQQTPLWEFWQDLAEKNEQIEELPPDTQNNIPSTESVPGTETHFDNILSPTFPGNIYSPTASNRFFRQVERSYLDDAVFIGDSRTEGLRVYGGLSNATFYASDGLSVYDLWTDKFCEVNGVKVTLEEALSSQSFGKVYFQIGINEMGRGTLDGFIEAYSQTIQKLRELQPNAVIFIQGIMRVTKEKSQKDAIFNNDAIDLRNERIAKLADGKYVYYIDMNEVVSDEEGHLNAELTFDDLHLYGSKYGIWVDFLLAHGI